MIKALKILGAAIIALAIVAAYLLFLRKSDDKVLNKVPVNSTTVMVIDVRGLSAKLLLDDFGKGIKNSAKAFAKLLPDSIGDIDWEANGIGLPDKVVLFTLEDTAEVNLHVILPISNAKKFNQFVTLLGTRLTFDIQKKDGITWAFAKNMGLLVAWNNHFACAMKTNQNSSKNLNTLIDILSTPTNKSIMADTCFVRHLSSTFDVMVYAKPYHQCPVKKLEILNDNVENGVSFLQFNTGEVKITSTLKPKNGSLLTNLFTQTNNNMPGLANNLDAPVTLRLNVNPTIFRQLYNQYKPLDITTNLAGYPGIWDGRLILALKGSKTIENEYTTYEYDDNFNKIEIKKRKQENILDIQAMAGIIKNKIDSFRPVISGKDTLLFTGGNMILKRIGLFYAVYNKYCTQPVFTEHPAHNNIEIAIVYPKLSPILKELGLSAKTARLDSIGINRITVTVSQTKNIGITSSISFLESKKNSFYSILGKVDWISKSQRLKNK